MNNFGHNYVIQNEHEIVSHVATYAETKTYVVLSGVITNPKYQRRG